MTDEPNAQDWTRIDGTIAMIERYIGAHQNEPFTVTAIRQHLAALRTLIHRRLDELATVENTPRRN